jgi:hypothetical protein
MDATAPPDERCRSRTQKSCGPDTPTLVSSLRINPQVKPGLRGEHEGQR